MPRTQVPKQHPTQTRQHGSQPSQSQPSVTVVTVTVTTPDSDTNVKVEAQDKEAPQTRLYKEAPPEEAQDKEAQHKEAWGTDDFPPDLAQEWADYYATQRFGTQTGPPSSSLSPAQRWLSSCSSTFPRKPSCVERWLNLSICSSSSGDTSQFPARSDHHSDHSYDSDWTRYSGSDVDETLGHRMASKMFLDRPEEPEDSEEGEPYRDHGDDWSVPY